VVTWPWFATLALGGLAAGQSAEAVVDLTKVDRAIRKEPEYKSKAPRYCLLVFGPRADYRVWLVLDGDTLYVDRDGNGDLTEPGKSARPRRRDTDPCSFDAVTITGPDGKAEELGFALYGWFDYAAGKDTSRVSPAVFVTWKGRKFGSWGDDTGRCVWGRRPQEAPVLHIGGPLQMGFEIPAEQALNRTGNGQFELSVGVGTRGLGKGAFVHLSYANGAIPEGVSPTAVLEFPGKTTGGPPVRVRAVLQKRC
jgi:hypothetical protein